jgi:pimeloyl-ACP methyl ester carboxylesterase
MGGALAARLAYETERVRVLVLLAPYLTPPGVVRWIARTSWLWGPLSPYLRGRGEASVHDTVASAASRAYGTFSPGALHALMSTAEAGWRVLPKLTAPMLVVNSKQDNRIPPELARRVLRQIRVPVEAHWVTGCGHVLTMDYCKEAVAALVLTFLARHAD